MQATVWVSADNRPHWDYTQGLLTFYAVVWQGVHGEEMDWAPETSFVSQFLVEMWREIV